MTPKTSLWQKIFFWLVLVLAGLMVGFTISLPVWNIYQIEIRGNNYVPAEAISSITGQWLGQNVWFLPRWNLGRQLKKIVPLKRARLSFWLPSTLQVRVEERTPYLLLDETDQVAVADSEGRILARGQADEFSHPDFLLKPELFCLPVVRGIKPVAEGNLLPADLWPQLEQLVTSWQKYLVSYTLRLEYKGRDGWSLILADCLPVYLGDDRLPEKIEDLAVILSSEASSLEKFEYLNLRLPENYVVKYRSDVSPSQGQNSRR